MTESERNLLNKVSSALLYLLKDRRNAMQRDILGSPVYNDGYRELVDLIASLEEAQYDANQS